MPLRYEIVVRNATGMPVFNVRLDDEVPPGGRLLRADPAPEVNGQRLTWNLDKLEPGTERRFRVEVQPPGEGEMQSCAVVTCSAAGCLKTTITRPRLTLTKTGPETVQVGDPADFQIQIANVGTGPAYNVVLRDLLPEGLRHVNGSSIDADLGTLAAGESKQITLKTTAVKTGRHINQASAMADNAASVTAQAAVLVNESALLLRKTGPQTRFLNREAEFDLEVSNPGTAPATNVLVVDTLPQGLDFMDADEGGVYDPNTRSITWTLGVLAPEQRRGLHTKLLGRTQGNFVNQAVARADRGLESKAEAPLRIEGIPALMLEVVDLDDPVEAGAETIYEIRILNQGSTATTGLQVIATAPPGMAPRSGEGPTPYRIQGQQIVFEPIETLAARADVLYRVRVLCQTPGDWRFKVQMSSEQLRIPVYEEEATRIYNE